MWKAFAAALVLLGAMFVDVLPSLPGSVPTAQAAELNQWWGNGNGSGNRDRDRDRDCDGGRGWGRGDRDCREDRHRSHREGNRNNWEHEWNAQWGDCFRTPWGRACETNRQGVYRVRDRHPGDEPGPDCDILIIEDSGWRCIDLPNR